ncbi:MAG: T9SS type A sorting domain-containing protein [Candidatus Zixiibacteriota bacterium]|nr:MAG: T9SS type A sorting domain-containing protein [candidate division Zixibacteria bacterium]
MGLFVREGLYAADTYDIHVNDDHSIYDQTHPRITVDRSGNSVVVWTDTRSGQKDIYLQFFDSSGILIGYNRKLNDDAGSSPQMEPALAGTDLNQLAAVWRDYRNGSYPFRPDIYFARADTLGSLSNIDITAAAPDSTRESPDIAVLSDGSFIVVWSDYRNRNWDIYGRRLTSAGDFVGDDFVISHDTETDQQHSPRVTALHDGGFVVVWYDNRNGHDDIYFQRFDQQAIIIGSNTLVNDDGGSTRQAFPAVAADGSGRFFIAWVDWRNGVYPSNPDIYLRRYSAAGTPLGASIRISGNDGGSPQRDVALCSDPMGNLGSVWADSSSGQWDVRAQIIDHTGQLNGPSFLVHEQTSGKQLQPDITSDGYRLYFAWADRRSGNFDIYASVIRYNDPTLIPDPPQLEFTMEQGGMLPSAQTVGLSNAGYGELHWLAIPSVNWIAVSPDSGRTPQSIAVSISVDTLPFGTHFGQLRLVNIDHNDSSVIIPVRLTITAPLIEISPDTLHFSALVEVGDPAPQCFEIANSGTGNFEYAALAEAIWFSINRASGSAPDEISVQVNIAGLDTGHHFGQMVISSDAAANSPETAWVHLELAEDLPYLAAEPDSVVLAGVVGDPLETTITVTNPGAGTLDWTSEASDTWFTMDITSGMDNDVITVGVETGMLASGYYCSEIKIIDSASFNQSIAVPVELFLSSGDSISFLNNSALPGSIALMPLFARLVRPAKAVYLPFACDSAVVSLDSVVLNQLAMPAYVDFYESVISLGRGEISLRVSDEMLGDSCIPPGYHYIANVFFTARDTNAICLVDTVYTDSSGSYLLDTMLQKTVPAIKPGSLIVGTTTGTGHTAENYLPGSIDLKQNFPNPFNAATTIEFHLPSAMTVTLEIFNVLGQTVRRTHTGRLPRGIHRITWDGMLSKVGSAPSGVYFYRLSGDGFRLVRKMVLLK